MDRIVLDTDILIDHVHGRARWIDDVFTEKSAELIVPTIVIAEYHTAQELETVGGLEASRKYLATYLIQDLTQPIAETLGSLLRKKSYPSGASMADLIIAATAITLCVPLATRNTTHFRGIPGVTFFQPEALR